MPSVYTAGKIFHFDRKLSDLLAGRPSAPIHVRLKPTNRCNHCCEYCCYRNPNLFLGQGMDEDDEIAPSRMERIVSDMADMDVKAVTISGGGEPLCYPYIRETLESLLSRDIKTALLTNGSLLTGDAAAILAEGASWVRVSMDGASPESYAGHRAVSVREFDRVCANLRAFSVRKRKDCELGVNFIVTRRNHGEILSFLRLMKELGVDHVKVSEAVVSTRLEDNLHYLKPIHGAVMRQIREGMSTIADHTFAVIDKMLDCEGPESSGNLYGKAYERCPFIRCMTVIGADEKVYTCQDKAYTEDGLLGSIRERSFKDFWYDERTGEKIAAVNPALMCNHHCTQHEKNLMILDYLDADPRHLEFV